MIELAKDARRCLGNSIRAYYERLNLSLTNLQEEKLLNLENLNLYLSEHGFLFPWLGVFRIPLMLHKRFKSDSVGIFIINDHVHRREQPWTRDLNIYFRGLNSNNQNNPIVMKCDRKKPLHLAQINSEKDILALKDKIHGKISQNISWYESENNSKVTGKKKAQMRQNVDFLTNYLIDSESNTENYSDCLARFNINLISETNPDLYDTVLFVSFTDLMNHIPKFKDLMFDMANQIVTSINNTIEYQKNRNLLVYKNENLSPNHIPFWFYCPDCYKRNRGKSVSINKFEFSCGDHFHYQGGINDSSDFLTAFDVISIEVFTSFLNLSERIVGSLKNYSLVVDNESKMFFEWNHRLGFHSIQNPFLQA